MLKIKTQGLEDVLEKLRALESMEKIARMKRQSLEKAYQVAKRNAPSEHMKAHVVKTDKSVKCTLPYAVYVEFGTSKTPPKPFMRKAQLEGERAFLYQLVRFFSEGDYND